MEYRIIREILPDLRHQPLYTASSARSLDFNPNDQKRSHILWINFEEWNQLTGPQIQSLLKNRHILVTEVPHQETVFNCESLSKIGHLTHAREIQGKEFLLVVADK
jgi:hypothetical protein